MELEELRQATEQFYDDFPKMTWEQQLDFIRFNHFHFSHPLLEVMQLYVQNPKAKVLKTFEEWKQYSTISSVRYGERALRLEGKSASGNLFDVSQTTLAESYQAPQEPLDRFVFLRSLGNSLPLEENPEFQFIAASEEAVRLFLAPHLPANSTFSQEENRAALALSLTIIFEKYGLLEDEKEQQSLDKMLKQAFGELENRQRLLSVIALGDSFSRGISDTITHFLETQPEVEIETPTFVAIEDETPELPASSQKKKTRTKREDPISENLTLFEEDKAQDLEALKQEMQRAYFDYRRLAETAQKWENENPNQEFTNDPNYEHYRHAKGSYEYYKEAWRERLKQDYPDLWYEEELFPDSQSLSLDEKTEIANHMNLIYEQVGRKGINFQAWQEDFQKAFSEQTEKIVLEQQNISQTKIFKVEWNETEKGLGFLGDSHDGESITAEILRALIRDEHQMAQVKENGYVKLAIESDGKRWERIDVGDGMEVNASLYQEIATQSGFDLDVASYYASLTPKVEQSLSPNEILDKVLTQLKLSDDFKVVSTGENSASLVKQSFDGVLIEPLVNYEGGDDFEILQQADKISGISDFQTLFETNFENVIREHQEKSSRTNENDKEEQIFPNAQALKTIVEKLKNEDLFLDEAFVLEWLDVLENEMADRKDLQHSAHINIEQEFRFTFLKELEEVLIQQYEAASDLEDDAFLLTEAVLNDDDLSEQVSTLLLHQVYVRLNSEKTVQENSEQPQSEETLTEDLTAIEQTQLLGAPTWEELFQKGTNVSGGKYHIQNYFEHHFTDGIKAKAKFIKKEYGIGALSLPVRSGGTPLRASWNSKGLTLGKEIKRWNVVVLELELLVHQDNYLSEDEKENYERWKREQLPILTESPSSEQEVSLFDFLGPESEAVNTETSSKEAEPTVESVVEVSEIEPSVYQIGDIIYHLGSSFTGSPYEEILEISDISQISVSGKGISRLKSFTRITGKEWTDWKKDHQKISVRIDRGRRATSEEIKVFESFYTREKKVNQEETTALQDFIFSEDSQIFYSQTPTQKIIDNVRAIELMKNLEEKNRKATASEQKRLAKYVGWGGLANSFFDESNPRFEEFRKDLKQLCSPQELAQMKASSLTAYYSDPRLIREIYRTLQNLGFQGGRILDPAMGTGNFFASLPKNLRINSELYGVELDSITGAIAGELQQNAQVQVKGFEATHFVENSFDVIVTNVPFGQQSIQESKYDRPFVIHDYFIKKSLDLVHEGGFVAVITSTATLDKKDDRLRRELSEKANLVTAVRLPDNAFSAIAGTEVTSDVLIFQKTTTPEKEPDWLSTVSLKDAKGNEIFYNRYFDSHPEQVLGEIGIKTFRGGVLTVKADYPIEELSFELSGALENHVESHYMIKKRSAEIFETLVSKNSVLPPELIEKVEPYTLFVYEEKPYYHNGEKIELYQKSASVTLRSHETRKSQLTRYQKAKATIFDEEVTWQFLENIPRDSNEGQPIYGKEKALLPPQHLLDCLEKDGSVEWENKRYVMSEDKIDVSEKVSTQYFYHQDYSKKDVRAMSAMIEMRHTLQSLLAIQHEPDYDKAKYEYWRRFLNHQYDTFVSEFGAIGSQANSLLMRQDDYYEFLASIEEEKEDDITKLPVVEKAVVFFEPTIQQESVALVIESADDALLASLNHRGKLDFDYICDVYPKKKEAIIQELGDKIFYVGEGNYETREDYLSGDVKTKLATAKNNQEFALENRDWSGNITALEAVIPADLPLSDIYHQFGARFIPTSIYQQFLMEILEQTSLDKVTIVYDTRTDSYQAKVDNRLTDGNRGNYGMTQYEGIRVAQTLLNLKEPQIFMPDPEDVTGKKRILDNEATSDIREKAAAMKAAFEEWVLHNPEAQEQIILIYNDIYNRSIPKSYDGKSITVSGLAKQFQLRPHQKNAVLRIVQEERAGLFHEVGSGKTLIMLASSMKLKELGVINKPMYVVPKPLLEQFGREIYKYFPESRVLVAQSEDFSKANRKRFVSRIVTGKYDAVVIADSQFGKVAMSKAHQLAYLESQLNEIDNFIQENGDDKSYTVKNAEQLKERLKVRVKKLQKQDVDTFIDFEALGIDMLYVDEAHGFKNLAPMTQLANVKGVSDTRSQKAMDLEQKVQYLHEQFDNKRVVFATGTPISNSVTELYTMMHYLSPELLAREGISHFDAWVSTFGTIESVHELNVAGDYRLKRRFTKFSNMPELRNLFREIADIQTAEDLDLPVPHVVNFPHLTQTTSAQASYIESLIRRAERIEAGEVKPWQDNMLKILGENRKLTLDMRMLDDVKYGEFDSDKLSQAIDEVYNIWEVTAPQKSAQMIFSDLGIPIKYKGNPSYNLDRSVNDFSAYDEIKHQLIKRGIPEQEIRFIHEATDSNKESMMREVRTGKIRILIASTAKGGTGLNVQDKLVAVHHLDVPWRPSDFIQRNGRIIRQGNENATVQIHYYITKGSMDAYAWQTQENKKRFVDQIMSGKSDAREMEELDNNEMSPTTYKALAEGDPVKAEYMLLERELSQLASSRQRYYEGKASDEKKLNAQKEKLPLYERRLEATTKDIAQAEISKFKPFELSLFYKGEEKRYNTDDKKAEVGDRLIQLIRENVSEDKKKVKVAIYRGFEIYHVSQPQTNLLAAFDSGGEMIKIKGETEYTLNLPLTDGSGTIQRIANKIDGLTKDKEATEQEVQRLKAAIVRIEADRNKPYSKEQEFQEKTSRSNELRQRLGMAVPQNQMISAQDKEHEIEMNV